MSGGWIEEQKPRRNRANLRPRSRSASVIDRLLKIRTHWEIVIIFDHPRPPLSWTDIGEPRRNFAVRNSSTRGPWLFRSPVFGSGIRRLDRRGGRRPPPREDPARASRSSTLFNPGSTPVPHHVILDCKIVARLFTRWPAAS